MSYLEGTIEIPMEEFWKFVNDFNPTTGMETVYGVPKVTKDGNTMEIKFAAASDASPADWTKKPLAVVQWEEHKKHAL